MKSRLACLAVAAIWPLARRQRRTRQPSRKHGGILKMYHRETPPSISIHEEATYSINVAVHADLQQPRALRSAQAAEQHRHDRARAGDELGVERATTSS